jgi:6-phosphogluconolactonase
MNPSRRPLLVAVVAFACVLAFPVLSSGADPDTYHVYIGTYTDAKGSEGIYRCELDAKTGQLSKAELVAKMTNPSFLAVSPNGKYLYAVSETQANGEKKEGAVVAFGIAPDTGKLTKLNETTSGGGDPCHISINGTGRYAIVSNYTGGSWAVFKLEEDGKLGERTDFHQFTDKPAAGANKDRQDKPHTHCGVFWETRGTECAYVVDLGLDRVYSYKLDHAKGKLEPTKPAFVQLPAGTGPRHIAFHRDAGKAFVCGELNSTLHTLRAYEADGTLQLYDGTAGLKKRDDAILSTLPARVSDDVKKKNSTAEVVVIAKHAQVFVSNRGHNTLAMFRFNADKTEFGGEITGAGDGPRAIATPRNFNIDPTGKWILIANQDGGNVVVAQYDPNGAGKVTGHAVDVAKPVCIRFLAKPAPPAKP